MSEIFGGLGADVVRRGYSDRVRPGGYRGSAAEDVALAKAWAEVGRFDLLVSADGDGDRPLVGDELGNWMRGDVAGILTARFLDARRRGNTGQQQHRTGKIRLVSRSPAYADRLTLRHRGNAAGIG